jgi:hypothetical protein
MFFLGDFENQPCFFFAVFRHPNGVIVAYHTHITHHSHTHTHTHKHTHNTHKHTHTHTNTHTNTIEKGA